jgi:outer membrane immunogenic protein
MFRSLVVYAVSVVALASAASAADMYRAPDAVGYKDGPAYVSVNWSGVYFGGYAGYGWGRSDTRGTLDPNSIFGSGAPNAQPAYNANMSPNLSPDGFSGGGTVGYNWQTGRIVFGAEAEFGALNLRDAATTSVTPTNHVNLTSFTKADTDWAATLRGRLGWSADRALFFATGGAAFRNFHLHQTNTYAGLLIEDVSISGHQTGWTAGGGVEYMLSSNWLGGSWSGKIEYLHMDFGTISGTDVIPIGPVNVSHSANLTVDVVHAGLNYHVGSVYEPLK